MKTISLNKGYVAIVDDEDFENVSRLKWCITSLNPDKPARKVYARHSSRCVLMHRFILNAPKGIHIDHINHDTLDNRKINLRLCTVSENLRNRGPERTNKSGFKGVYWNTRDKVWRAQIKLHQQVKPLGTFRFPQDGAMAYDRAAIQLHGEFAVTNQSLGLYERRKQAYA